MTKEWLDKNTFVDGGLLSLLLREPAYKIAPKTSEAENEHTHNLVYTICITITTRQVSMHPTKKTWNSYITEF